MPDDQNAAAQPTLPTYLTLQQAADGLRDGSFTSRHLTQAHLDRIAAVDDRIKAFITVTADQALAAADTADAALRDGSAGPLTGIPIAVKDLITTAGIPTTCASRMLENFIPTQDASVVQRLHGAGAVILGKTNLDEFAMGSSNETSAFFPTGNPWDVERVPGGSSGGSAAAVAAGDAPISIGSDTGNPAHSAASWV